VIRFLALCLFSTALAYAGGPDAVSDAVAHFQQQAARCSEPLRIQFQQLAATYLQVGYPELARRLALPAQPARASNEPPRAPGKPDPQVAALLNQMRQIRGLPTDADRAKLVTTIAEQIPALPVASRLSMASNLANLSTEGDLGMPALTAVAGSLAQALQDAPANAAPADAGSWLELASLVRYEHVPASFSDPALDAASAMLSLRDVIRQEAGFALTSLAGKTYSLAGLRGHVVLLNFWATWCPPCRREMPDMEKLYRAFGDKGLIVLAVSDEDREKVTGFLAKQNFTFPILLDPGRKVHTAFGIEGIPNSFIFDREGRLAAEAIDMRTESQFLELLKKAGL
jgi:peroxiredoxin